MHKLSVSSSVLITVVVLLWATGGVMAAPPAQEPPGDVGIQATSVTTAFTYQGSLTDGVNPGNGTYDFQFELYNALTGGGQVDITNSIDDQLVTDGLFSVELDFGNSFDGTALWLQINVRPGASASGYTSLSPRQPLTATPYAVYALNIPTHDHQGESWSGTGAGLTLSGGSIGLSGSGSSVGVQGLNASPGGTGVYGDATATSGFGVGVQGLSASPGGTGVYGGATATSGLTYGMIGESYSPAGIGVQGMAKATSGCQPGFCYGVYGWSAGSNGTGVYGGAGSNSGSGMGVSGWSNSPDGFGVVGSNTNNGWAGSFEGKARVTKNLGVGTVAPFPPGYSGGAPLLHVVADSPKSTAANTRVFAITTNDASNPFGLDVRLTGADALTDRAVFMQTTDFNAADGGNILLQPQGGNVGIGTTNPTKAKVEINGGFGSYNIPGSFGTYGPTSGQSVYSTGPVTFTGPSLYASGQIVSSGFVAFSDERIKKVEGRSDAAQDLVTLAGIEVTDYSYIDTVTKGMGEQKKVIAQQVETVYPQAVSRSIDVVPDIYQQAPIKDGWVEISTDLQAGERVRLIGEQSEGVYEVLEVTPDGFRTDFVADGAAVFVYGREVDDFRSVDYEAIAMLNVSATQELNRLVEQQAAEIEALNSENEALNTRLTALEQAVSSGPAAARAGSNAPLTPWLLLGGIGAVGLVVAQKRWTR